MERLFKGILPPPASKRFSRRTYIGKNLLCLINEKMLIEPNSDGFVPAGLTYMGQMIAHDIVPPTNQISRSFRVRSALTLSSLYGRVTKGKVDEYFNENGLFKLGESWSRSGSGCIAIKSRDVLRYSNGKAKIPDSRNDENVIVSQLHLVWLKLHNKIVSLYLNGAGVDRLKKIKKAQKLVARIFHWITVDEFLRAVLDPTVFDLYILNGERFLYEKRKRLKSLPIEFSHGAFRFGHSMIRRAYQLNGSSNEVDLSKLFLSVNNGSLKTCNEVTKLNDDFFVEFRRFFENPCEEFQMAFNIDTAIAIPMRKLHINSINSEIKPPVSIASHNVKAGESVDMPFGEDIYKYIRENCKSLYRKSGIKGATGSVYSCEGKIGLGATALRSFGSPTEFPEWPLWLYCLAEAHRGINDSSNGELGKIASIIVAEVLVKSIEKANPVFFKEYQRYSRGGVFPNKIMENISADRRLTMSNILDFIESG